MSCASGSLKPLHCSQPAEISVTFFRCVAASDIERLCATVCCCCSRAGPSGAMAMASRPASALLGQTKTNSAHSQTQHIFHRLAARAHMLHHLPGVAAAARFPPSEVCYDCRKYTCMLCFVVQATVRTDTWRFAKQLFAIGRAACSCICCWQW